MIELPKDFRDFIQRKLGSAFPEFIGSLETTAPTSIRINPAKRPILNTDQQVPWSDFGLYLAKRPVFTLDPLFHAGAYYVQEASSMFLEQVIKQSVALEKSLNVLDLSAAPGGKSTHLLSLINSNSLLVSNEVIRSRASILAENIQKWGNPNSVVTNNDPEHFQSLTGFFDVIVVDAPCSGEGLFRKDPEAMKEWSLQNVSLCSARQKRIVSDVWPALKENGILIYCTCTYNESENEENLEWFSQQNDIEFLSVKRENSWGVEEVRKNKVIGYQFFPHRVKGEGFFISAMRKLQPEESRKAKIKNAFAVRTKKIAEELKSWIRNAEDEFFAQHNDRIFFLPKSKVAEAETLLQHLKIVNIGTGAATAKHEKLIPEHSLALSTKLNQQHFTEIPLSYDDAIKYLRKDPLTVEGFKKGFAIVTYENVPLGWVNVLDNRINNLYPSEWRIRMASPKNEEATSED